MFPTKLMRLYVTMDLLRQRQRLDNEGKYNEPVILSGFPRGADQVIPFQEGDGTFMPGMQNIILELDADESAYRVLTRVVRAVLSDEEPRADDLNDLQIDDGGPDLLAEVRDFLSSNNIELALVNDFTRVDELRTALEKLKQRITYAQGSRYHSYHRAIQQVKTAVGEDMTIAVDTAGKSPAQIAQEVAEKAAVPVWQAAVSPDKEG